MVFAGVFHRFVVVAPSVLRVGSEENILLEAFGLSEPVIVNLSAYSYPRSSPQLLQGTVTLNADNNYSVLKTIVVILNLFFFCKKYLYYYFKMRMTSKMVVLYMSMYNMKFGADRGKEQTSSDRN